MNNPNAIRLNGDGKTVIMQVSDAQDMVHARRAMLNMLDKAYDTVKPDLVVFTGDNILGNHLLDARIGNRQVAHGRAATLERIEKSLANLLEPLERRSIPFAMIYGNHDDRNCVTKEEQARIYKSYSRCLPMNVTDSEVDCDTYNIPVLSADGKRLVFNLWLLDCAWYDKQEDKCYESIKKETVEWYIRRSAELKAENGGVNVPSLLFQHIAFEQIRQLCVECSGAKPLAVESKGEGQKRFYCLDEARVKNGVMGEYPSACEDKYGLFEAIKANGDVMAVVTGHDHRNRFEGRVDGIDFVQTSCASFRCYGNDERGVRVFVLDESRPGKYETYFLTYADLCGDSAAARLRYIWDADDKHLEKGILITAAAAAAAGMAAQLASKLRNRQ